MAIVSKPKSLSEVRDGLCGLYQEVMGDPRRSNQVREGCNALGKVVGACKTHLEYCALSKKTPVGDWAKFIGD